MFIQNFVKLYIYINVYNILGLITIVQKKSAPLYLMHKGAL